MTLPDLATAILATLGERAEPTQLRVDSPDASPSVAALLQQSRAQHTLYRRSIRHIVNGVTLPGNPDAANTAFREAARRRAEAELADPSHADASWPDDLAQKFPHAALLEWYQEQIVGT